MSVEGDVTSVLNQLAAGDADAAERLYALLYDELRKVARQQLRHERSDQTLQATELVHETYLRLVDQTRCQWNGRLHFLAIASQVMRRILVDHARGRGRQKRGGDQEKLPLDLALNLAGEHRDATLIILDLALNKLALTQPEKAKLVELHFFGGLNYDECSMVMGISPRTVSRHWEYAKAWLYREMSAGGSAA
jgi:RNA polymerase sigma-70 factor, ECF subfamily